MRKMFIGLFHVCFCSAIYPCSFAQTAPARTVPFNTDNWAFTPGAVQFMPAAPAIGGIRPQGNAMKITGSGEVAAKNIDFSEGAIEFDMLPTDSNFAFFYFHRQDANEAECFYLRTGWGAGRPDRMEAVQYNPIIRGTACWNLMPYYQGNASFKLNAWSHIRIVISGRQMLAFLNSSEQPTLIIPRLEGNTTHGSLAFEGQMVIANLVASPEKAAAPALLDGYDPTNNDPRYLRHWQVTLPDTIPPGIDFSENLLPGKQAAWAPIQAERRGLINLTRVFGGNTGGHARRIAWLKTTLRADKAGNYKIHLGFTNDVWVFLNGQYLFIDKNHYDEPSMKVPRGRVSIENSSFNLPLKAGVNEILIGVANDFFGWGIVARLDDNDEVKIE